MAAPSKLTAAVLAAATTAEQLAADAELARLRAETATLRSRYKAALAQIDRERERADALAGLKGIEGKRPAAKVGKAKSHAASMVMLLSDIHCEETVRAEQVNGLNRFDLDVCDARLAELSERFFAMLAHERQLCTIDRVVVWLGGDLISGMIHPELAEENSLHPLAALRWIGERLRGFIDAVADNARDVLVVTSCGNHGRTTEKLRTNEADTSYEHHLYVTMAAAEQRKNVSWLVGEGHLHYVDLDGFTIRYMHGHAVRFQGGIGGIHVPLNKAIAAWDSTRRADLTCLGHWHQFSWSRSGRYVTNGSVIGPSAYSVRIKAAYEPPCQAAFVVDHHRREVTRAYPVFCDRDLRERK
jgi:predicted phosphodiesterase